VQTCFTNVAGSGLWVSLSNKKEYRKIMLVHKLYEVVEQSEVWY